MVKLSWYKFPLITWLLKWCLTVFLVITVIIESASLHHFLFKLMMLSLSLSLSQFQCGDANEESISVKFIMPSLQLIARVNTNNWIAKRFKTMGMNWYWSEWPSTWWEKEREKKRERREEKRKENISIIMIGYWEDPFLIFEHCFPWNFFPNFTHSGNVFIGRHSFTAESASDSSKRCVCWLQDCKMLLFECNLHRS